MFVALDKYSFLTLFHIHIYHWVVPHFENKRTCATTLAIIMLVMVRILTSDSNSSERRYAYIIIIIVTFLAHEKTVQLKLQVHQVITQNWHTSHELSRAASRCAWPWDSSAKIWVCTWAFCTCIFYCSTLPLFFLNKVKNDEIQDDYEYAPSRKTTWHILYSQLCLITIYTTFSTVKNSFSFSPVFSPEFCIADFQA